MRNRKLRRTIAGALLAAGLALLACAVNPVTGRRQLSLLSESQEVAMGAESDPQIVAEFGLYDDPKVQAYVDAVGQKMARLSHRPDLKFTFRVLDSPVINAFALPGGYVYITRGILAHMNSEAELAIVVGHEIGHVTARHGVEQYTRAQIAGIGLGVGSLLSDHVAQFGQAAQQGLGLLFLKYGRDDENQADQLGVEYALRAGYDARAGSKFFEVLDRQTQESGSSLPEWLSTHPAPAGRVQRTHDLAVQLQPQNPAATRVGETDHKSAIEGIVFGDDPRQGYVRNGVFLHPALAFQLTLPGGWQVQNTPSALLAGAPDGKAALKLTLEQSNGEAPAAYAARLAQSASAAMSQSSSERVGGYDAYVAVFELRDDSGAVQSVQTGFVQRKPQEGIFQIVGMAAPGAFAAHQQEFLSTIRSFRALTDRTALGIQPNRIHVETLRAASTFEQAFRKAASPVGIGTVALVNNLQPASPLAAGFQLKLVRGTFQAGQ